MMNRKPTPQLYGLWEQTADGGWTRIRPSLAFTRERAIRVFQNALLEGALGGGPLRELRPVGHVRVTR